MVQPHPQPHPMPLDLSFSTSISIFRLFLPPAGFHSGYLRGSLPVAFSFYVFV